MVESVVRSLYPEDPKILPGYDGPIGFLRKDGTFAFAERFKDWMYVYQDGRCGYCGVYMGDTWLKNRGAHVEHIENRNGGGGDLPPNVMYACSACNRHKNDQHFSVLSEWIQYRESDVASIITRNQAAQLAKVGIDLGYKPTRPFHFSAMNWAHVQPAVEADRQRMAEESPMSMVGA